MMVPSLSVVDGTSVSFFLRLALQQKEEEEERERVKRERELPPDLRVPAQLTHGNLDTLSMILVPALPVRCLGVA